jgi:large subunit ribosomal protein L28
MITRMPHIYKLNYFWRFKMAKRCDICGKGPISGSSISHAHNVNKRRFLPNIHKMKIIVDGNVVTKKVCTRCLKAGKVVKG